MVDSFGSLHDVKLSSGVSIAKNSTEYVRLSDVECYDDGSGWCATIQVGAGEFVCTGKKFYFGDPSKFLETLKDCYKKLSGFAELKTPFEEEFLRVSFLPQGHVEVSGLLRDYGGRERLFKYAIAIDQTFLHTTISSLEALIAEIK